MHYFRIQSNHSMIVYKILTEYYWEFRSNIDLWESFQVQVQVKFKVKFSIKHNIVLVIISLEESHMRLLGVTDLALILSNL